MSESGRSEKYVINIIEELAIQLKKDLKEWEEFVGIDKLDDTTKNQLKEIARKSEEILE